MRRYNIVSRIILILTVITFALAAPASTLVQDKRQACVDVVHVPEDVTTVLGKRTLEEDFNVLWDGWWHYLNVLGEPAPPPIVWGNRNPAAVHLQEPAPPPNPKGSIHSEDWYAAPKSLGSESSTESDSDPNPNRWLTISKEPSAESQSENLKAADSDLKGKAKDSGTASGVDTVKRSSDGVAKCG